LTESGTHAFLSLTACGFFYEQSITSGGGTEVKWSERGSIFKVNILFQITSIVVYVVVVIADHDVSEFCFLAQLLNHKMFDFRLLASNA